MQNNNNRVNSQGSRKDHSLIISPLKSSLVKCVLFWEKTIFSNKLVERKIGFLVHGYSTASALDIFAKS